MFEVLLTIFKWKCIDFIAKKISVTDRQTDRMTDRLTDICIPRAAFAAEKTLKFNFHL